MMHESSAVRSLSDMAISEFTKHFGQEPSVVAQAPGRINLIGEHVDYTGGRVLPMAINKWIIAALRPCTGSYSRIYSSNIETEHIFDACSPSTRIVEGNAAFANHALGVLEGLRRIQPVTDQYEILIVGDIPIGAGLSSSAALEVSLVRAWASVMDLDVDDITAAHIAMNAEHDFVGTPCGIMDMLISAAAHEKSAMLIDCRNLGMEYIDLPPESILEWTVVNTGISHTLASSEYSLRRKSCSEAEKTLGMPLRDATTNDVKTKIQNETDQKRALHVVQENLRVIQAVAALRTGDLEAFGECMYEGHTSLRELYEVTIPEHDLIVRSSYAMRKDGVYGARMTGGGFGGSVIVAHAPTVRGALVHTINTEFIKHTGRIPDVYHVHSAHGAGIIS